MHYKEDPARMLLFSLTIQPIIRSLSRECNLCLNRWYADDVTLAGRTESMASALRLLTTESLRYNLQPNAAKTRAFWPNMSSNQRLDYIVSLHLPSLKKKAWIYLGLPSAHETILSPFSPPNSKCRSLLNCRDEIPNARVKHHFHRVTASASHEQQLFKLVPPRTPYSSAKQFDNDQMHMYSKFIDSPVQCPKEVCHHPHFRAFCQSSNDFTTTFLTKTFVC